MILNRFLGLQNNQLIEKTKNLRVNIYFISKLNTKAYENPSKSLLPYIFIDQRVTNSLNVIQKQKFPKKNFSFKNTAKKIH